ncbi:hypothetical protein K491DRAFT_689805 [Lophiostoma macrostomum CBS 122681]|uniref:Uncharacterized protein n=1 Tax=Lophiostoma macrostomum CBS 122681 TaxID=1314788 RepID=A0A6A6TIG0_9PLEO|nr:hypothetical protein K491DRAFT_689805 [Lophiostoma macrostomum CBS 122681]
MSPNQPSPTQTDPSLSSLPAELRFLIYAHLFVLNGVPTSFGYSSRPQLRHGNRYTPLRTHALLLASTQLSLEYRHAFYERTRFFLRIDSSNAFRGAPGLAIPIGCVSEPATGTSSPSTLTPVLASATPPPTSTSPTPPPIPRFWWHMPSDLLPHLRHCTLYIEIGDIAPSAPSTHSLALEHRANASLSEAKLVREEMKRYSSFAAMQAANRQFDDTLVDAVHKLLEAMRQLRSVMLVWDTSVDQRIRRGAGTCWGWEELGGPFVRVLEGREGVREVRVRVGDCKSDHEVLVRRGEGGVWERLLS